MHSLCGTDNFRSCLWSLSSLCSVCFCLWLSALDWPTWAHWHALCGFVSRCIPMCVSIFCQGRRDTVYSPLVLLKSILLLCAFFIVWFYNSVSTFARWDGLLSLILFLKFRESVLLRPVTDIFECTLMITAERGSAFFFQVSSLVSRLCDCRFLCVFQMCLWTGSRMSMKWLSDCAVGRGCRGSRISTQPSLIHTAMCASQVSHSKACDRNYWE